MHLWDFKNLVSVILLLGLAKFKVSNAQSYTFDCSEYPTVIRLSSQNISDLQVIGSDNIVISRNFTLDAVTSPCSATLNDPYFSLNLMDCDPYVQMANGVIDVTWTIRNQPQRNSLVQRYNESCLNFTCSFNCSSMVTSDELRPILRQLEVQLAAQTGQFSWNLDLYSDSNHTNPIPAFGTVQVPDRVYVGINLTSAAFEPDRFIAQVVQCWATPTPMSSSSIRYDLVTSSCSANEHVAVTMNYMTRYASFNFASFVWTENFTWPIYVHCSVCTCDTESPGVNCTALNCTSGSRKRRDIQDTDEVLSFGPIKIVPSSDKSFCSENNGGCSDVCSVVNNEVSCSCRMGSILGSDGRTCVVELGRPSVIQSYVVEPISSLENPFYTIAIVMLFICIVTGAVYIFTRKKVVKPMAY